MAKDRLLSIFEADFKNKGADGFAFWLQEMSLNDR